jgi:hypothetical protein
MKLLKIQLMNSCNKHCEYCPAAKWHKPVDFYFPSLPGEDEETALKNRKYINAITNEALLRWLDEYIDPKEYYIEITGGEPSLYPEITTLIPKLSERGYFGIIRTNGTGYIPHTDSFTILACWHTFWGDNPPSYFNTICIIKNPKDNWRWRKQYCKKNSIPYHLFEFDESYTGKVSIVNKKSPVKAKFTALAYISSMGQLAACQRKQLSEEFTIFNMSPPFIADTLKECPNCIHLIHAEEVLSDEMRLKVERDYEVLKEAG